MKDTVINIPATLDEVTHELNETGRMEALLKAKQWDRAAFVYAWTRTAKRGPKTGVDTDSEETRLGVVEFGALGITGLSASNVTEYRKAWESAWDDGPEADKVKALGIKPGDAIERPKSAWKDHFGEPTKAVQKRVAKAVLKDPVRAKEVITEVIEEKPEARSAIVDAVLRPHSGEVVEKELHPLPHHRDHDRNVRRAISDLDAAFLARSRGTWTPAPSTDSLLRLSRALLESGGMDDYEKSALHEEIKEYLSMADELPEGSEVAS